MGSAESVSNTRLNWCKVKCLLHPPSSVLLCRESSILDVQLRFKYHFALKFTKIFKKTALLQRKSLNNFLACQLTWRWRKASITRLCVRKLELVRNSKFHFSKTKLGSNLLSLCQYSLKGVWRDGAYQEKRCGTRAYGT